MLTPTDIEQYEAEGYVVARKVLDLDEVHVLRAACDELTLRAQGFQEDKFIGVTFFNIHRRANPFAKDIATAEVVPGQLRRVTYPYAISEVFNRFRTHPRILACAASVLGPNLVQIVNQVNFNPPKSGVGWGWHQDYRFRKAGIRDLLSDFVQTLLAIDLCNEQTGGLRLIPGSKRLGSLALDQDNENAERHFDATKAITPVLEPGDMILFNSHTIHGSTANGSSQPRRVYINGYARATASIGMPVLRSGVPVTEACGIMEYEGDQVMLPKASKY